MKREVEGVFPGVGVRPQLMPVGPSPRPVDRGQGWMHVVGWVYFALLFLVGVSLCLNGVLAQDEGEMLAYPRLLLQGWMPYTRIWMMYPPGTYVLIAFLMKIGIPGLLSERAVGLGARVVYVLCVNRAFSGSWRRVSWIGMPVAFLLVLGSFEMRAYPWFVGLPFLYLGLMWMPRRPWLAAVLFFVSGLFRFELAVAGFLGLSALAVLDSGARRRYAVAAASCVAASTVFFLVLAAVTHGNALREIFVDPILYIAPQRYLPLFPPQFTPVFLPIVLILVAGPFFLMVLAMASRNPLLAAWGVALMPAETQFLHRADSQYAVWTAGLVIPLVLLGSWTLVRDAGSPPAPAWARRAAHILCGAVFVVVVLPLTIGMIFEVVYASPLTNGPVPHVLRDMQRRLVSDHGRTELAVTASGARAERRTLLYLDRHASASDTLFVAPTRIRNAMYNATDLYYLTDLRPASRYMEMNPGVETRPNVQREIITSLRTCRWVILYKKGFWRERSGTQHPGAPYLARYITHHYSTVLRTSLYLVLERRGTA